MSIHQLLAAASMGDDNMVRRLLVDSLPHEPHLKSIALRLAADKGHLECVKLLIPHSDPKADDSAALRWAAEEGHLECVKLLIPHSDPKADDSAALRWSANNGHLECVKLLIPHSDPKADDSGALRLAAEEGNLECVRELMPHSDPVKAVRYCIEDGDTDVADVIREQMAFIQKEQMHAELGESLERAIDAPRKTRRM